MTILVTVWWLLFFTAFGLCLGSFLNVVVYRLPLGLRVSDPVWSFCPNCRNRIAWYDNLPVISYLRLRGRCRHCWQPIDPRYPVVELLTAMSVILLLDTFCIAQVRDGLSGVADLSWRLSEDWPILVAHIVLFTALLAMSAVDLQFYWVDIRFTHFAALCGLVLHMVWTPYASRDWFRPYGGTAAATTAAILGFGVVWLVLQLRPRAGPVDHVETRDEPHAEPRIGRARTTRITPVLLPLSLLVFLLITAGGDAWGDEISPFALRAGLTLLCFFGVIIYEASHVRAADTEIVEAIESEAPGARKTALAELAALSPGMLLGIAALVVYLRDPDVARVTDRWIHWRPCDGQWQPLWGLSTAITGYVIAAGIGWTVRIAADLLLGKEAFATGDIHMMAAAGCVLGWQVVLIGFMITCLLAVVGWVALLPFKKTRAIPLGPWLWIGFLTTTVFYEPLENTQLVRNVIEATKVLILNNSQ